MGGKFNLNRNFCAEFLAWLNPARDFALRMWRKQARGATPVENRWRAE
jgi:hypothetical protein